MLMIPDGKEIVRLRQRLGMNQREFAALLGVSVAAVCRWELEKRLPRREHIIRMNELLSESPAAHAKNGRKKSGVGV